MSCGQKWAAEDRDENPCRMFHARKKLSVFIGRFQPLHNGHVHVIEHALALKHEVLVLIGSANKPRCPKNPFNLEERERMIKGTFAGKPVHVNSLSDYDYDNERWKAQVCDILAEYSDFEISIIGYHKDDSSFYLKEFPEYPFMYVDAHTCDKGDIIHATDIRKSWYKYGTPVTCGIGNSLPYDSVKEMILMKPEVFFNIQDEYNINQAYLYSWKDAPWPVTLVTTDALVLWHDKVLLIKRKFHPGKDLWAMPGGFVDKNERIQEGMFRELKEETGVDFIRKRDIRSWKCFDEPGRGERGRTFSHVYLSEYKGDYFEPIAGDDAIEAKWVRLADLKYMCREMYSDHWGIINFMIHHRFPNLRKELTDTPATC